MEVIRSVSIVVEIDTNKRSPRKKFDLDEDETVGQLMLRVQEWLKEQLDD